MESCLCKDFYIILQKKLREKIVGSIFVDENRPNELHVDIKLEREGINYHFVKQDIATSILYGYTTDDAVWDVYRSYKAFINRYFFFK